MALQMTSSTFSYHRLESFDDVEVREEGHAYVGKSRRRKSWRKRGWWRLRRLSRGRPRIRIPSLIRRLISRRKTRQVSTSWIKVWKRLKESRSYMGDLFAGNYMFMQVSPSPVGSLEKSFMGQDQHEKYPLPRVHV